MGSEREMGKLSAEIYEQMADLPAASRNAAQAGRCLGMANDWRELSLAEAGVELIDCAHKTPAAVDSGR